MIPVVWRYVRGALSIHNYRGERLGRRVVVSRGREEEANMGSICLVIKSRDTSLYRTRQQLHSRIGVPVLIYTTIISPSTYNISVDKCLQPRSVMFESKIRGKTIKRIMATCAATVSQSDPRRAT